MPGNFSENFILEQTYLLFSFQQQDSLAGSCHSPFPIFLLSGGVWFGSRIPQKSSGARSTLSLSEVPQGLHEAESTVFKDYFDNLNAPPG